MAYPLIVLLSDATTLSLGSLADGLRKRFSDNPQIKVVFEEGRSDALLVQWHQWSYRIIYEDGPHVLAVSREIAAEFAAANAARSQVAACRHRLLMAGDDDPKGVHFPDYLAVVEVLWSFSGFILFDPQGGEFVGFFWTGPSASPSSIKSLSGSKTC